MHCDFVGVWLPDVEHVYLRQLAMDFPESKGFAKEDALQPIGGSVMGTVFKTGEPVVLDYMSGQLALDEATEVRAEALESGCALPLISRGRTLGVLMLGSRCENSIRPEDADFLTRAMGQLAIAIENRLAHRLKDKLAQEKLYLEDEIRGELDFEGIVGQSSFLRHFLNLVETVAPSDSTVLLLGETGTGKELIARAIHERSRRKDRTLENSTVLRFPADCLRASFLDMNEAPSQAPLRRRLDGWSWLIRALSSWMRWEIFPSRFSPSCSALCKNVSLKGWATTEPSKSMCGWWRQPIAIWRR
jgi:formate hydrogenlyase transcriptional activator